MKISWSRCPHCKHMLEFDVEGGAGTTEDFGPKVVKPCPKCNGLISNNAKEWPELPVSKKCLAVFRCFYTALFFSAAGSGVVTGGLMYSFDITNEMQLGVIWGGMFIPSFVLLLVKHYKNFFFRRKLSIERFNEQKIFIL